MTRGSKNTPKGFSLDAKKLWLSMHSRFNIPEETRMVLLEACKTLSALHDVRKQIEEQGRTYETESGVKHINPLCRAEKDLQSSFLQAMRLLPLGKGG